ncbi:MAG: hypothetical protein O2954_11835 [bacterium]|nr:hypothetical protein [bacterium]
MGKQAPRFISCLVASALLVFMLAVPVQARSFFTSSRTFGILFLGGSAWMGKKAIDFRRDANVIFDAYKVARTAEEAERLYRRTSDRDTKSQISLGMSLLLLAGGLRLMLSSGVDDNIPKLDRRLHLDVQSDIRTQTFTVGLKGRF